MKRKKLIWSIAILVLATPIFFIYLTISSSMGCNQFVIDTYEFYSGINIPEVESVNCYYDEDSKTQISVYELDAYIDLSKFEISKSSYVQGMSLIDETERPSGNKVYLASGEKWGTKWTYIVDNDARKLWAELKYAD